MRIFILTRKIEQSRVLRFLLALLGNINAAWIFEQLSDKRVYNN